MKLGGSSINFVVMPILLQHSTTATATAISATVSIRDGVPLNIGTQVFHGRLRESVLYPVALQNMTSIPR